MCMLLQKLYNFGRLGICQSQQNRKLENPKING